MDTAISKDSSDSLLFINSDEQMFYIQWERFIRNSECATWRYLPKWREFQRHYTGDAFLADLSFVVADHDKNPLAICPVFLEKVQTHKQFSFAFSYQPGPLLVQDLPDKRRQKIESVCFQRIDELAQIHGVGKTLAMLDPLGVTAQYNSLQEYGFLDASLSSMIIDLTLAEEVIWSRLRKSFQSLINKALKIYTFRIFDHQNADYEIHELYREMHHKAAGRVTRVKKTFDLQFDMLKDDNALLIGAQHQGQWIAFDYFFHHHRKAFYGSAADDPDVKLDNPVGHSLIWSALKYYQSRKFLKLDMGLQQFGVQWFDNPSDKDISISFFKRGFGGDLKALYRGIKYYDPQLLEADLRQFKQENLSSVRKAP